MTRRVHGHLVNVEPCDGLRDHWRVRVDGTPAGLIVRDRDDWRTLPARTPGCVCAPVCHCPNSELAIATLVAETETT